MEIRPEASNDCENIYALTKAAFDPMPFSDGTEADCIKKLRVDGDLKVSLVALKHDRIIGHIEPSRVCRRQFGLGYAAMAGSSSMA